MNVEESNESNDPSHLGYPLLFKWVGRKHNLGAAHPATFLLITLAHTYAISKQS